MIAGVCRAQPYLNWLKGCLMITCKGVGLGFPWFSPISAAVRKKLSPFAKGRPSVAEDLQEELLLVGADALSSTYLEYLEELETESEKVLALALHVRMAHWIAKILMASDPKATSQWLELCSSARWAKLSAQLDAAVEVPLPVPTRLLQQYFQLMEHESSLYTGLAPAENAFRLLQVARITPPRVLIIAGSDSGGGAGLQADLKSCSALGAFGTTAVTALTAQNTHGVQGILPIPSDFLQQQIDSVLSDIGTDVVKTGMLATSEIVKAVAASLTSSGSFSLVLDPVMVSTSGHTLLQEDAIQSIKEELFPLATLITPNLPETCLLLGIDEIKTVAMMEQAARELSRMGPRWVLIKGGHLEDLEATDVLCDAETQSCMAFKSRLIANTCHTHGTGCTLASAIAAHLSRGLEVPEAVQEAKDFVTKAIAQSSHLALGTGTQGPMNHSWAHFDW